MIEIVLTKGMTAKISDEDADLATIKWTYSHGYAVRNDWKQKRRIYLHRVVASRIQDLNGLVVDHIDHDSLNNCRENLRGISHKRNIANRKSGNKNKKSPGIVGVHKSRNRLVVRIGGKTFGYFDDPDEASRIAASARQEVYSV